MLEVKWKAQRLFIMSLLEDCFNPCYVGSKMESESHPLTNVLSVPFQSLLCWK